MKQMLTLTLLFLVSSAGCGYDESDGDLIILSPPSLSGDISIEEAINARRSVRNFSKDPLSLTHLSQVLWAAQGITGDYGFRTAPSAGALYPLETYIVVSTVDSLVPGVYRYIPDAHALEMVKSEDVRSLLADAALNQSCVRNCDAVLVFAAVFERVTRVYGDRGMMYVFMEAGHASQNVYLQCVSLGLGTVAVGAFDDSLVSTVLELPDNEHPLYLMPLGTKPTR